MRKKNDVFLILGIANGICAILNLFTHNYTISALNIFVAILCFAD